ncbi:MAG: hypothetical protein V4689_12945 [Verrucomicrobiota bacterium]
MSEKPVPIYTERAKALKIAVWENKSDGKTTHAITLVRNYKDDQDQWHESNVLFLEDLPKMELLARKAYEFLCCGKTTERQPESFAEKVGGDGNRKKGAAK